MEDWYHVGTTEFIRAGGRRLLDHYDSLRNNLLAVYPQYPNDISFYFHWLDINGTPASFAHPHGFGIPETNLKYKTFRPS